jgi:glucose-1-phosphate cytidylyltransferase
MNGGFFVFRREIFDYIGPGQDLVNEPFAQLIEKNELTAWRHDGFYYPVDTLKDRQILEDLLEAGNAPWSVWDATQSA